MILDFLNVFLRVRTFLHFLCFHDFIGFIFVASEFCFHDFIGFISIASYATRISTVRYNLYLFSNLSQISLSKHVSSHSNTTLQDSLWELVLLSNQAHGNKLGAMKLLGSHCFSYWFFNIYVYIHIWHMSWVPLISSELLKKFGVRSKGQSVSHIHWDAIREAWW